MRKLVLLLVCLILFLFYSAYSDCPTVDNLTSGKVLEDFKNYFSSDSNKNTKNERDDNSGVGNVSQQRSRSVFVSNGAVALENDIKAVDRINRAAFEVHNVDDEQSTEELSANNVEQDLESGLEESQDEPIVGAEDENSEQASQKILDLTLPQFVDEVMDMKIFKYEYKSILPDLFRPVKVEEEESRTSFGGRVLMDEEFDDIELDQYRLQDIRGAIEGAEITLEVKTN